MGLTASETEQRADDLLRVLDLQQGRHTVARECSFGMRKKTALAMALIYRPDVLLLDEPFEGIDPASSEAIQTLLRAMADEGAAVVMTSHILPLVQTVADRVILLADGLVVSDMDPRAGGETVGAMYARLAGGTTAEVPGWLRS